MTSEENEVVENGLAYSNSDWLLVVVYHASCQSAHIH